VFRSREKTVLLLGGGAAALILLLTLVVIPDAARVRSLSRQISLAEKDLADLRKMRPELERADREVRQMSTRATAAANAKESPLARLTSELQEAGFPQSAFSLRACIVSKRVSGSCSIACTACFAAYMQQTAEQ